MSDYGDELWDLYGDDQALARARANVMGRRAQGLHDRGQGLQGAGVVLRALTGERDPTGGALLQLGGQRGQQGQHLVDQLTEAAQHGAQGRLVDKRMAAQARQQEAALGRQMAQDAATQAFREAQLGMQREGLGLKRQQLLIGGGRREQNDERRQRLDSTKAAGDLRKELQGQQVYKDAQTVSAAWEKIKSTGESGAGDMSLIFGYMKILDPTSTVREGEYATAANAGSIPENVWAAYNRAKDGEKLAPTVRADFRTEARKVYDAQLGRYRQTADRYKSLAEKGGIAPEDVVLDVFGESDAAPQAPSSPAPARVRRTVGSETREWDGKAWVPIAGGAP